MKSTHIVGKSYACAAYPVDERDQCDIEHHYHWCANTDQLARAAGYVARSRHRLVNEH